MDRSRAAVVIGMLGLAACPSAGSGIGVDAAGDDAGVAFDPPLGATTEPGGGAVWFRLASARATRVELWIYSAPLGGEALRVEAVAVGDLWTTRVTTDALAAAGVTTIYYGYRVWGPNWRWDPAWTPGSDAGFVTRVDADGNRMDPNKLLIDPYARELSHDPVGPDNPDGTVYRTDDTTRDLDSGPVAAKGIVVDGVATGDVGIRPERALRDDVIYEVHLRGLTRGGDPADPCRGTYAAAAARAGELAALGVTAIEVMPVQETTNDRNDLDPATADGDNYWGYSTLAWFAPDRRYACDRTPGGPSRELQAMVRAFHDRGLKVLVDVVYNHTAEGGGGSLLSWRGIDNAMYYELDAAGTGFADQTGIGASTNATDRRFQDLVLDSLAYWHQALGVDGFRFDLAPVLGNGCDRSCFTWEPDGSVLTRTVGELPARPVDGGAGVDLIAEPWGVVGGTYRLGQFPPGWSEWNDRFRDLIRSDQNQLGSVDVTPGWLADRIAGSPELFGARGPGASVAYLDSHDGFTLRDLYYCTAKNNDQPWPYGPSNGGTDDNRSWNQTGDPVRQRQAARTGLALVLVSAGVPMFVGGDEMLRSQRCNNNPYNLDSIGTWLDPADAIEHAAFVTFTARLLAFRAAHPALRPRDWHDDATVTWLRADGTRAPGGYLDDPGQQFLAWRLDGAALGDPVRAVMVAYNGGTTTVAFTLPAHAAGTHWYRVADTGAWLEPEANIAAPGAEYPMNGSRYDLAPRSLVLFIER